MASRISPLKNVSTANELAESQATEYVCMHEKCTCNNELTEEHIRKHNDIITKNQKL